MNEPGMVEQSNIYPISSHPRFVRQPEPIEEESTEPKEPGLIRRAVRSIRRAWANTDAQQHPGKGW